MLTTLPWGRLAGVAPLTGDSTGAGAVAWAAMSRAAKALAATTSAGGRADAGDVTGWVAPAAAAWTRWDDKTLRIAALGRIYMEILDPLPSRRWWLPRIWTGRVTWMNAEAS